MNQELREYFAKLGRKGGKTTVEKHGKLKMSEWGKMGGRPKKRITKPKKIAELSLDKASG